MRIDCVTIFPEYFRVLDLSLMGRAREAGLVDVAVHDLRRWTTDRHRTVDAAPYGGGPGMVMRADVWGRALDEVLGAGDTAQEDAGSGGEHRRRVLAFPSPSGARLTQAMAEDLAGDVDHLVIACGRYEGIDQRVSDHYRSEEVEVLEFSIGDYVLNGGEVAALVLVETVVRLLDGVLGNPDSLVEESYAAAGLLEYPVYTRPRTWRDLEVPAVLVGGDHARIARWRHDRSLVRTARRRRDLVDALDPDALDGHDREVLAGAGCVVAPRRADVVIRLARPDEAGALAVLARDTFPLACPDFLGEDDIRSFVEEHLSETQFDRMLRAPDDHRILVAQLQEGERPLVGYTLTVLGGPDGMPAQLVRPGRIELGAAYLSKCYTRAEWHGSGIGGAMLERAVADVRARGRNSQIVLGTNIANTRAHRFYRRHGFRVAGRRTFLVGGVANIDDVFVRNVTPVVS